MATDSATATTEVKSDLASSLESVAAGVAASTRSRVRFDAGASATGSTTTPSRRGRNRKQPGSTQGSRPAAAVPPPAPASTTGTSDEVLQLLRSIAKRVDVLEQRSSLPPASGMPDLPVLGDDESSGSDDLDVSLGDLARGGRVALPRGPASRASATDASRTRLRDDLLQDSNLPLGEVARLPLLHHRSSASDRANPATDFMQSEIFRALDIQPVGSKSAIDAFRFATLDAPGFQKHRHSKIEFLTLGKIIDCMQKRDYEGALEYAARRAYGIFAAEKKLEEDGSASWAVAASLALDLDHGSLRPDIEIQLLQAARLRQKFEDSKAAVSKRARKPKRKPTPAAADA